MTTNQFLIVRKRYNGYEHVSPREYMYLDKDNNIKEFPFPYNGNSVND